MPPFDWRLKVLATVDIPVRLAFTAGAEVTELPVDTYTESPAFSVRLTVCVAAEVFDAATVSASVDDPIAPAPVVAARTIFGANRVVVLVGSFCVMVPPFAVDVKEIVPGAAT